MARKMNQKTKILRILDHLREASGEKNALTIRQLSQMLEEEGISCERRTMTSDITILTEYVEDNPDYEFVIRCKTTGNTNYYYSERKKGMYLFSTGELKELIIGLNSLCLMQDVENSTSELLKQKLIDMAPPQDQKKLKEYASDTHMSVLDTAAAKILIDSIRSFTFLDQNVLQEISQTIKRLIDIEDIEVLEQDESLSDTCSQPVSGMKHMMYGIDTLMRAIDAGLKITFRYFDLNERRERVYRHNNQTYVGQPLHLLRNDDHYYLICYDPYTPTHTKHFRVDRMDSIALKIPHEFISPKAKEIAGLLKEYQHQTFRMYGGPTKTIVLEFEDKLIGQIFDKFGPNIEICRISDHLCRITTKVQMSPPFFGWLFQFSDSMQIISPKDLVREYTRCCQKILKDTAEENPA